MSDSSNIRLRVVRQAQGKSLRRMQILAGVDKGYLSKIERGLASPSVPTLLAILRALELTDTVEAIERVMEPAENLRPAARVRHGARFYRAAR